MTLYHFTCDHGHRQIVDQLLPGSYMSTAVGASPFVWMTNLESPNRDALGLTSHFIDCDRTSFRYRVTDESSAIWWMDARRMLPEGYVGLLESSHGARPMHWWISLEPVPAVLDAVIRGAA